MKWAREDVDRQDWDAFNRHVKEHLNDNETKLCPRCGLFFTDYPALSRTDNETYICSQCGMDEAFEDFFRRA
jgi:predicted RNA-binding Zn-ribbon protein involved in translation (DUF1610 family)